MHNLVFHVIHATQWILLPVTYPLAFAVHGYYCPENDLSYSRTRIGHVLLRAPSAAGAILLPYPFVESATKGQVNELSIPTGYQEYGE